MDYRDWIETNLPKVYNGAGNLAPDINAPFRTNEFDDSTIDFQDLNILYLFTLKRIKSDFTCAVRNFNRGKKSDKESDYKEMAGVGLKLILKNKAARDANTSRNENT